VSDSCYIGKVWQQPGGSQAVYVNASGKLGTQVSSRRFKDEIKPMEETSEVIYRLKPVSFRYKPEIEPTRPRGFGLIAEDVEKINPDLVLPDKKEHRKVQELEAVVANLVATVKEQAKQIQKVSAQLGLDKPAPQTVLNDY